MPDKLIRCSGCRQEFCWTVREQKFFGKLGFPAPVRCLACREKHASEVAGRKERRDWQQKLTAPGATLGDIWKKEKAK